MIAEVEIQTTEDEEEAVEVQTSHSYLVVECGHCNTSVTLFDVVGGRYRLVARGSALTTAGSPWFDATLGVKQAIRQISLATGRRFFDQQGSLIRPAKSDGSGVDEFGLVISVGDPQRIILAGLLEEISIASARKVINPLYARVVDSFSLSDMRNRPAQVMALLEHRPDVILLTGGTDGGADRRLVKLVQTLAMGIDLLDRSERPAVVFAGNAALRGRIDEILGELTDVFRAENVRPKYEVENLDHATNLLSELLLAQNINAVPGLPFLRKWSSVDVGTSDHAFVGIGEYFAARMRGRILCLDLGSNHVTLALVSSQETRLVVQAELGVGHGAAALLTKEDLTVIRGWTGDGIGLDGIRDRIANKASQPNIIPLNDLELHLELGMAQRAIQRALAEATEGLGLPPSGTIPEIDLLLLRGRVLTGAPNLGKAMLALINGLEPGGIFRVIADDGAVLPAMGLLAAKDARLVVEIIDSGVLDSWGWVIVPEGSSRSGQIALEASLQAGSTEAVQLEIMSGSLAVLPLATNEVAEITLKPAAGIDVGNGKGKSRTLRLKGGLLGIVIDARGRPLPKAKDADMYQNLIQQSLREIGA
jgi:hypothetical protein